MHLPERWGFLQFSDKPPGAMNFTGDATWGMRTALVQTYYALHKFQAINGYYVDDLEQLGLPGYVVNGSLHTAPPVIDLASIYSFSVRVESTDPMGYNPWQPGTAAGAVPKYGTIRGDRYMEFPSV